MTGQLTGSAEPEGVAVDAAGTLYVADYGNDRVIEYAKPYAKITAILSDPGERPFAVAVSRSGMVGVTNILSKSGGPGNVALYAKGATTACAVVRNPAFSVMYFGAFDDTGKLYVDAQDAGNRTHVGSIAGGCGAARIADLKLPSAPSAPGPIAVTRTDDIVIGDRSILNTYAAPVDGTFGAPNIRRSS